MIDKESLTDKFSERDATKREATDMLARETLRNRVALRHAAPSSRLPSLAALCVCAALMVLSGCVSTRYVSSRTVRANPLAESLRLVGMRGPQISERTQSTLQRYGLANRYQNETSACFDEIRSIINETPDAELIYALSELSYVEGKKAERLGDANAALNYFGVALTNSYDFLFSEDLQQARNPYDPQFRAVCDLYNQSLEDTLRMLCRDNKLEPGQTYTIQTPQRKFVVHTEMRGKWKEDEFARYEFVSDYEIETLRNRHTTYGLGVPLIAVRHPPAKPDPREGYYPDGLSYAVSAMMRCPEPLNGGRAGEATTCVLEFFDPLAANQVQLASQWIPLETDLTTPLAYFLDSPEFRKRNAATDGLLNPNDTQSKRGLYMLEPYDPERIPVLMVHGLWSSPMTWMDMFNDLRSFPEIRERYQFWFYLYPSGQPFWMSATQLRQDLAEMRSVFDPGRRDESLDKMVLVGHSMGGLVSRMQTIDSGDDFWKIVSGESAPTPSDALARIRGPEEAKTKLVSALYFKPNQSIRRVITIGTPHAGSDFANDFTRWLARKIIKLPRMNVSTGERLAAENPFLFRNTELLTTANAIDSLAPESAIFPVMLNAKTSPGVKFHNIIGVLQKPSFLQRKIGEGDGVVSKRSAQIEGVSSELTVDAEHTTIHMIGKTIFEVRRILMAHLEDVDAQDRLASRPEAESVQER